MKFDEDLLGINFGNGIFSNNTSIHLLGGYAYSDFKTKWHAGFQTTNEWPLTFSYNLDYKQRDSIGDARTNWELNRHFQFALLAKAIFVEKRKGNSIESLLEDLSSQFYDWNKSNPFLRGISWTSVMEIAIRSISWMFTLAFLKKADVGSVNICTELETGILNMVDYVTKHYSRFSSANNHLLVESLSIGIAGYCFHSKRWKTLAVNLLTEEITKQNYSDGVNKELSLHYQTFGMEAYALMSHVMKSNGDMIPELWLDMMEKQCEYVSHCMWKEKSVVEFGDDDEGKILDLQGGDIFHPVYVLQLCSLILDKSFSNFIDINETVRWLFPNDDIERIKRKETYNPNKNRCFSEGGNTFLRDKNGHVLIGIDHAALGFGTIAAHGHADALSLQLMVDGKNILVDPGTFIYHCNIEKRNEFRKTINHNTLSVNGKDQSEMLGAFLWGKKANCKLIEWKDEPNKTILIAEHDGYSPIIHQRKIEWNNQDKLIVLDTLSSECNWTITWMLSPECKVDNNNKTLSIYNGQNTLELFSSCGNISIEDVEVSVKYGLAKKAKAIRIRGIEKEHKMRIFIK